MSRLLITGLIVSLLVFVSPQDNFTLTELIRDHGKTNTTIRLVPIRISGPKDRYHSLSFSVYYSYPNTSPAPPEVVDLELVSVVKTRKLNTDLYVVFLVDGKEIHFGSSRSAIRNPVRGKPWIGERMVFHIPREDFLKFAEGEKLGVKLGGVTFEFGDQQRNAMRMVAQTIREIESF